MLDDKPIARISSARGKRHLRLMAARPGLPLLHIAPARWMLHEPPAPIGGLCGLLTTHPDPLVCAVRYSGLACVNKLIVI